MSRRISSDLSKLYQPVLDGEIEIDALGQIWRVAKRGWDRWLKRTVVRPCERVRGEHDVGEYFQFRSMCDGKRTSTGAHRLVYFHFYGEIPEGLTVNHKNGNKKDNHPDNLELMTDSEQAIHARHELKHGRLNQSGELNNMSKLTEDQVKEIIRRRDTGEALLIIAKDFNIAFQHVSRIHKRQRWSQTLTT